MLHCVGGDDIRIAGSSVTDGIGVQLQPDASVAVENRGGPAEFLLLQGMPIGAPVFQMGPFVMNTPEELRQAFDDYNLTGFGGWPWSSFRCCPFPLRWPNLIRFKRSWWNSRNSLRVSFSCRLFLGSTGVGEMRQERCRPWWVACWPALFGILSTGGREVGRLPESMPLR